MPINDSFTFDGKNSADFGLLMASDPEAIHPARRGKSSQIVGRNGVFVREDGSYDTYTQTYDVMLDSQSDGVYARSRAVANWLLGSRGFCRLEDTFEPDVFKLARYAKQLSVENRLTRFGRAQIAFEVQPQRYLKSGEVEIKTNTHNNREGIELSQAPFGAEKIAVRITAPSGTALSGVTANFYKDGTLYPCTIQKQSETESTVVYYGERAVVDEASFFVSVDDNSIFGSVEVLQVVGNETETIAVIGNSSPAIINPTQFEARPLLKFVDTSEEPPIVSQTLTANDGTIIAVDGEVSKPTWEGGYSNPKTSDPVSVNGYAYAYVWGNSYAFYDSNGKVVSFDTASKHKVTGLFLYGEKIVIPATASTIVVGSVQVNNPPAQGNPNMALSLQAARPNPGASAVTINGTTISLDFSVHDTIYLDCDLHDAYYIDGSSANDKVSFASTIDPYPTFPAFAPGENTVIVRDGDNLDFSIVPRWWEL